MIRENSYRFGDRPLLIRDRPLMIRDRPLMIRDKPRVIGDRPLMIWGQTSDDSGTDL
ncbi:MAG: hypothetical protein LBQ77_00525 [Treponema sp.]|nr:hypothetical protein [Treponema sp.]